MKYLIIGNGFDLAHDLPTSYSDFLFFLKHINDVNLYIEKKDWPPEFEKYFNNPYRINKDEFKRLIELASSNLWVYYFAHCNAEIQGWIDMEREMIPVAELIDWVIVNASKSQTRRHEDGTSDMYISECPANYVRIASVLPDFFECKINSKHIKIKPKYCNYQYGLLYQKMLDEVRGDLVKFIEIFRIYLNQFVETHDIKLMPIISSMNVDRVLSFNYISTEKNYDNLKDLNICHVHGYSSKDDSIVLGVNELKQDNTNRCIFMVKYYQRLVKRADISYKSMPKGDYSVTVFGHSLDVTDSDVLEPILKRAKIIEVYYYDESDREKKIVNLISLLTKDDIEKRIYHGFLSFKKIK